MKNYFKLLRFLKGHGKILILAAVFMVVSAVFDGFQLSLIIPVSDRILTNNKIIIPNELPGFLMVWVERINNTPQLTLLWVIALSILVLFILKGVAGYFTAIS